jgi:hypothetical protein
MFFRVAYRSFVDPSNTARSPYLIATRKRWQRPTHKYMGATAVTMQKIA